MENATCTPNPLTIVKDFTTNIAKLIKMMSHLYLKLKHRSIKNRFWRIQKKLKEELKEEEDIELYKSQESLSESCQESEWLYNGTATVSFPITENFKQLYPRRTQNSYVSKRHDLKITKNPQLQNITVTEKIDTTQI